MVEITVWHWVFFNAGILALLLLDLGIFHKKSETPSVKSALWWSAFWVTLALLFNILIYKWMGSETGLQFLTGYLIEKSLSVDNIFVFIMVFSYFAVPPQYQHKVLFWGIIGALIMRFVLILVGAALIQEFHWIIYIFGGFLVFTGIKMGIQSDEQMDPEKNPIVKLFRKYFPVTKDYVGNRFFTKIDGKTFATPLFVVVLVIEITDLVFAVDSIPAIFAITTNPFIVYTSNVFAILGLRSLYFALSGIMDLFHYLKYGLALILVFVGTKMMIVDLFKIPIMVSLLVVVGILAASVILSLLHKPKSAGLQK
ncbi:MAG: TerC family protein [Bacteroidetes bacterium]|nr:TerC family protein [Bacteroidota bacterium]